MAEAIVVGTDGSDSAKRAVGEAIRLASALGAELHVVSAFEPLRGARIAGAPEGAAKVWQPLPDADVEATLSEAAAGIRLKGIEARTHAIQKDPADALVEVAEKIDAALIVVGNKGLHSATRRVLGNVPNQVAHRAACSVLIVATDRPGPEQPAAS
ncbi:MAG TPA: universal stress protein [Solirubrobacteraceae bacterium]|jgi:nucleotide-binding universal stress UspA family protein